MRTAVEEFLRAYAPVTMARLVAKDFDFHGHRYPDFELADPSAVTWSGGQVRGPRTLPITILQPGALALACLA